LEKAELSSDKLGRAIFYAIDRQKMKSTIELLAETLQNEEFKLRSIIDNNADSILIINNEGFIQFANTAVEKFLGFKKKELIGKDLGFPTIESENIEINLHNKNGSNIVAEINSVRINWEEEEAYLISLRDFSYRRQFEYKIMESEKKYRDLFENSPYPIAILNLDGKIVDSNSNLEKLIGYPKTELCNKRFLDFSLATDEKKDERLSKLGENFIPEPFEMNISNRFEKVLWVKLNFSLINLGKETRIHILIEDKTKLRKTEKEVRRLEKTLHEMNSLIEKAPQAIFLIHVSGKILRANEEAISLFQYPLGELLNFKIYEIFDSESKPVIKKYYENDIYDIEIPTKLEAVIINKYGKLIDVEITSTILRIADNFIIQSFFSDISERKNFETNRQLLLDQLISSIDFKTKFMATMSHELRTPLNAVLGFSQLLLDGGLTEDQKDFLLDINSAGDHLLTLINSILDLSKIEAGKFQLNLERIILKDIFDEVNKVISPLYFKKDLQYFVGYNDKDHIIIADSLRLKQILYNLLSNAIKFTEEGSITLQCIKKNNRFEFQVEDTGMGIAKKDYEIVFREFGRIEDDKIKEISGAGLGLALTKRLINLHGGEIWFESEIGKGSTFFFTIPINNEIVEI